MAWAKNGTPETLGSAGDVLQITDMTATKFNSFLTHELATGGNIDNVQWTFNNNTNSVYAYRTSKNDGAESTSTSQAGLLWNLGDGAWDRLYVGYVVSISAEEKLIIAFGVAGNTAGAGNAPDRIECVGKFVPSPDADITRIDDTQTGTGSFDTSSNLSALGSDLTTSAGRPTDVQAGSRFEETDTRKMYHYGGAGTVALDGTPQEASWNNNTSPRSVSITVGNHSNKALICCIYRQSGGATGTTSVKVGSNSFTLIQRTFGSVTGTGTQTAEIWYLLDDGITNNAVNQVDWVGTGHSRVGIGVYSLYNVNQGGGTSTAVGSTAYGTSDNSYNNQPNGVVNSVDSGDFILDQLAANCTNTPTDTLTEGWNDQIGTANRFSVSQYNASPSTNNNMFYSNVNAAEWAWSGARIKQSTNAWTEEGT